MQADYVLDYDFVSTAQAQQLYVLARINGGPAPSNTQRIPLNVSVVLDRSGSMAGNKIEYVKKATQFLIQHLTPEDTFSLVTYDSQITVDVPPSPVVYKDQISQKINTFKPGSSTNLSGGWLQGCQLVADHRADNTVNRVLLLTDGRANQGVTSTTRLGSMARQKREEGITTSTMGVGMDFNEDLLRQMATEGGGAFYFIDNPDQAPQIFSMELRDLLNVVGQNLVVTITPNAEVRGIKQFNTYPQSADGDVMSFRLGDVFAEETKMLLLELDIPALATLGQVEVANLRFDYDELNEDSVQHRVIELPVIVNTVAENEVALQRPNDEVVKQLLLLKAATAREQAVHHADTGNFGEATGVLSAIADEIAGSGIEDKELRQQHNMLREEAVDMDLGQQRYDARSRKTHTSKVAYSYTSRPIYAGETVALHSRMKAARRAIERNGDNPTMLSWNKNKLDLTEKEIVKIGRAPDNDVVIDESNISKWHCQITRNGDEFYLEDMGSRNGTFANGGKIEGRFRLSVGDVMTVGSQLFTFN